MKKIYILLIWMMVLACGSLAFIEVLVGVGSVAGLCLIIAGLSIIVYITRLPEDLRGGEN